MKKFLILPVIAIGLLATNAVFASNKEAEPFASIWEVITSLQTQIDNLVLVAGPQGPEGPEGPQGEVGPQGPAGEINPGFLPPPAFDSGWIELSQGTVIDVPHNVGGDYNDYFIYATYRRPAENGTLKSHQTAADVVWWEDVTANNIQIVTNGNVSNNFDAARIRIWKILE